MFHVLSIADPVYNVPLERLRQHNELKPIDKVHPSRKAITDFSEEEADKSGDRDLSYAMKSYRKAINMDDKRLELLHAMQIMSSPVITLQPTMTVDDAWRFFLNKGVRHMPVLSEDNQVIGIVSERDLLKRLIIQGKTVEESTHQTIAELMTQTVISASLETDIRRIARAMFESHIGTMPILDDRRQLIGIITRSDILFALVNYGAMKLWA